MDNSGILVIDGKRYKLVPIEEDILADYDLETSRRAGQSEVQKKDERPGNTGVKRAVGKVSDYRERYKKKKIKANEITTPPRMLKLEDKADSLLEGYTYNGENLFVGPGLEQEI